MAVTLAAEVLDRYEQFTLYNSPYAAHDHGHAVDLYPGDSIHPDPEDGPVVEAPSPVAGEVVDARTVTAPDRPYAADEDHLLLVDTGDRIARLLHVDPAVGAGDRVEVGDSLGRLVRAGFFAPWVANHLHLGFRPREVDPYRASGSLPLAVDPALEIEPLRWDGSGTVVAAGETYAVLDAPSHPAPGERFAGVAAQTADGRPLGVLEGGLPHYDGGGLLGRSAGGERAGRSADGVPEGRSGGGPVHLAGSRVGRADGRDVTWDDVSVVADGEPVRGIALTVSRTRAGVKLVGDRVALPVGTEVSVEIRGG